MAATADPGRWARIVGVGMMAALSAMVAACGDDPGTESTVTTSPTTVATTLPTTTAPPLTTVPEASSTTVGTVGETSIPVPEPSEFEEIFYRVVRQESTRDGTRLFLEITPGAYSDIDLENLVLSVYEERDDLHEVHVFDNREAVEVLVKPEGERTREESDLLDRHYLVSLLDGSILRFQGPFADLDGYVVGS